MTLLAAGWLALLVPWAALVAWTCRRVADERATTAAFLWSSETTDVPRVRASRGRPPAWVIAAMLAMLMAIAALSTPAYYGRKARVAIIVDGSVSLATTRDGKTLREMLRRECVQTFARARAVPDFDVRIAGLSARSPPADYSLAALDDAPFTTNLTNDAVESAIDAALKKDDAVIVLSGRPITSRDPRVALLAPKVVRDNVGIERALAVEQPKPSVMVRVTNDSERREATLEIRSHSSRGATGQTSQPRMIRHSFRETIALPSRGEGKNFFITLDSPSDEVEVALVGLSDDLPIDDTATLLRSHESPRLMVDADVPEVASRFASAFDRANRSITTDESRPTVRLSTAPTGAAGISEIILGGVDRSASMAEPDLSDHPILSGIDLSAPRIGRLATPPAGWKAIASIGGESIVAVRESPTRSVWIGFDLDPDEVRSVVLLANAVDWIAGGVAAAWKGEVPASIGNDWKPLAIVDAALDDSPGIYLDGDGRMVAVNIPAIVGPFGESRGDIGELLRRADRATLVPLQKPLALAGGSLACVAAVLVARRSAQRSGKRGVP